MNVLWTAVAASMVGIGSFTLAVLWPRLELTRTQRRRAESTVGLASAVGAFVVGALIGASLSGIPVFGLPVGMLAAIVPRAVVSRRRKAAKLRLRRAWPDAIRMLNAGLLSGLPLHTAMLRLEREGPPALTDLWARYRRLSATSEAAVALETIKDGEADPFVDRLIEVLLLAFEAGPTLATDILSDLALALNDDLQLELHIDSANLEQRINSGVVAVLPTITLFALGLSNDSFRGFYESGTGAMVVVIGTSISIVGLFVVDRLARTPAEPRIFVGGTVS